LATYRTILSETFHRARSRLTKDESDDASLVAMDLCFGVETPGMQLHRVTNRRDPHWWSARVNLDLRIILHRRDGDQVICHVDHHDAAYRWAEHHSLSIHEVTGAPQVVKHEVVEVIVKTTTRVHYPFAEIPDRVLLAYGVPRDWLERIRTAPESTCLDILDELPDEAGERMLKVLDGSPPALPRKIRVGDPFQHPDARRNFHVITTDDALRGALRGPWEAWQLFLHPDQRDSVDRDHAGAARVTGGPGTGKTVVCVHRAARLARAGVGRVLLTTYSRTLRDLLAAQVDQFLGDDRTTRARIDVDSLQDWALRYAEATLGSRAPKVAADADVTRALDAAIAEHAPRFPRAFVHDEWDRVIEPHGIETLEKYLSVRREARGRSLHPLQRTRLWPTFASTRTALRAEGWETWSSITRRAATLMLQRGEAPYAHVIADEAQDFGPGELALLRALVRPGANDLFVASDPYQRIYAERATLAQAGIEIRGRSSTLRTNYRTTEQIRRFADRLIERPKRWGGGGSSRMRGAEPRQRTYASIEQERAAVVRWLRKLVSDAFRPADIVVMARTRRLLAERVVPAIEAAGFAAIDLAQGNRDAPSGVRYCTMHRGKGLQFRAVVVMGVDGEHVPLRSIMARHHDGIAQRRAQELERNLLYVAVSRSRERLLVTGAVEASPLLPAP
jgi:hypothetical protein